MKNFILYNPVKLFFGLNVLERLPEQGKKLGKKVLLVYGRSSIKNNGLYDQIISILNDFEIVEYGGIKSNPIIEDVNEASKLASENNIDFILAVGGGSVIDSAKVISVAMHYNGDAWDIMKHQHEPTKATPVLAVLTLAATGTEMNPYAVIQNHQTMEKLGWGCPLSYPIVSFLDPQLTVTVPADYTAYGLADIIAHSLEAYFGNGNSPLSDAFAFSIIKEIIEAGVPLMGNLNDIKLRSRIMYAGTVALNGLLTNGKTTADWGVHALGHSLSMLYDLPHGASLSIAYPAWLKLHSHRLESKILLLGKEVFGAEDVEMTIHLIEEFFLGIGCPIYCENAGITLENKTEISALFLKNQVGGVVHHLTDGDRKAILNLMFETD